MDTELIQNLVLGLAAFGMALGFILILFIFYLKLKWLKKVEDILDDGETFFSMSFFFAGQGILHYASIFMNTWHAKRFGLDIKRHAVPRAVQRLFILAFVICMTGCLTLFLPYAILKIYPQ